MLTAVWFKIISNDITQIKIMIFTNSPTFKDHSLYFVLFKDFLLFWPKIKTITLNFI